MSAPELSDDDLRVIGRNSLTHAYVRAMATELLAYRARPAQATEGLREALTKAASLLEVMAEAAIVRGDAASWSMASVMAINARAALAPSKVAPMVSVKALSWSPNNHNTPDSVWTGELADLRIYYAIDPEDRVFRLERGWMMSEAGRDDLGLFPTRAAAEAFANEDWHNKLAAALEPLSQAEGQGDRKQGHSKLVYDKERRTIVAVDPHPAGGQEPIGYVDKNLLPAIKEQGRTEHLTIWGQSYVPEHIPLYTHPAETRSGQSIAAPSRAEVTK